MMNVCALAFEDVYGNAIPIPIRFATMAMGVCVCVCNCVQQHTQ